MIVRDVMTPSVITVRSDATVAHAAKVMLEGRINALPVVDSNGGLVGIVTHSDFGLSLKHRPLVDNAYAMLGSATHPQNMEDTARTVGDKLVRDVMSRPVATVSPEDSLGKAAVQMLRGQIHCLPVVEQGSLAGILTRHDFLKLITD